jgi:hypothetical protein
MLNRRIHINLTIVIGIFMLHATIREISCNLVCANVDGYSMYLLHFSLILLIIIPALFGGAHFYGIAYAEYALYGFLTVTISYLLFRYYELPMVNTRDKVSFSK